MSSELTIAVMLAITAGASVFVAWPLLLGRTRPEEFFGSEPAEPVLQRLLFQRDTTYAAMKELEFDFAMGNLSEQDHRELQDRYKRKAVAILKRIDDARAGRLKARDLPDEEDQFEDVPQHREAPARQPRRSSGSSPALDVEQEIEAYRRKSREQARGGGPESTPASGTRQAGDASLACPSCGRISKDPDALFCSGCGATLHEPAGQGSPSRASQRRRKRSGRIKGDHNE